MRYVTDKYKELMKIEANNIQHKYTFKNITRNIDFTEDITNTSLTVSRFLRTAEGRISPNNLSLSVTGEQERLKDFLVKDFNVPYADFPRTRWSDILTHPRLENKVGASGDKIEIRDIYNGEELVLFLGVIKDVTKLDTSNGRTLTFNIEDDTGQGHTLKFAEDHIYENVYISNNNEKDNSILHILATKFLGFADNMVDIADIKYEDGEYIKIPLIRLQKEVKIIQVLAELVRSVYGNIYTTNDGRLKINSAFDKSYLKKYDITFGNPLKGQYPILEFIENKEIKADTNKVEVSYTNVVVGENQTIFSLGGQNADNSEARVFIEANVKEFGDWWKIDFINTIEVNLKPIVKVYYYEDTDKDKVNRIYFDYTDYELEINNSGGRVRFKNDKDKRIYIEQFIFEGKPLIQFKNNTVSYTEKKFNANEIINIKAVNYDYVTDKRQAILLAKHTYYNECRDYNTLRLKVNNLPFLELEDIVKLDYDRYRGNYQIIAITQTNLTTELVLKQFREYEALEQNFIVEKSNYGNENYLQSKITSEKQAKAILLGEYEYNKDNITIIKDINLNLYDIYASIQSMPLNVPNAIKSVCEVVKKQGGFYIKVGVIGADNNVIQGGKALWIAKRKE